jgi:hypothetical protein
MKIVSRLFAAALVLGVGIGAAAPASADVPGPHPRYVHALSDLRYAHWLLHFPAEWNVNDHERDASRDVDKAFFDIRQAGLDDGKDLEARIPVDASLSHRDRLERALASIQRAHADIDGWESDRNALGARGAASGHLRDAAVQVREAIRTQRRDHAFGF